MNAAAATAKVNPGRNGKAPRKHHYVPVFYQGSFANESGLLWVYDRQRGTVKELHPSVICFEKDLCTVKPENKPHDMQVESKVLWAVDTLGSRGIRDFQIGRANSEAEEEVAFFAAFQYHRTPVASRDVRATYAKAIEELGRVTFANVERAKAVMEKYARDTGESLDVTPESMVEAVQGRHLKVVATEATFLTNMMEQATSLGKLLRRLDWEVLVAPKDTGFVICDCPFVVVPPKGSNEVGFLIPGSTKYLPLSRHHCLRLGDLGRSRAYRNIDKESVRTINMNIAANSERFIMAPSRVQLENIVSRSGSREIESTPRFTLEIIEPNDDGSLQRLSAQPRRYFYPKNGAPYPP